MVGLADLICIFKKWRDAEVTKAARKLIQDLKRISPSMSVLVDESASADFPEFVFVTPCIRGLACTKLIGLYVFAALDMVCLVWMAYRLT